MGDLEATYQQRLATVRALLDHHDGALPDAPSRQQLTDFAYGNVKAEEPSMTWAIAERAVLALLEERRG